MKVSRVGEGRNESYFKQRKGLSEGPKYELKGKLWLQLGLSLVLIPAGMVAELEQAEKPRLEIPLRFY